MKKGSCYIVNPKIVFRREGKDAILFNADSGEFDTLNSTGAFIWGLCNGKNTEEEILAKIVKKYDVPADTAKRELRSFIKDMLKTGFIGSAQ